MKWMCIFLLLSAKGMAQITPPVKESSMETVVKGKVVDTEKEPLVGVSILVKGTTNGTTTDSNGAFTLRLSQADATLVFSFIGMKTQEIKYLGQKEINVTMEELAIHLKDVVISTGYQVLDKRESASSVFTLSGQDALQGNAITIDNMLQGKVPGMMVLNQTSTPGAVPSIRIRGTSTISGNREPLWVVDGIILDDPVPISTEELNNLDNVNLIGNAISGINPMDIESINILKDASATAIYGVKAANGVIVVTTKRGARGNTRVNYSGTFTATARPSYNQLNRMNSLQRVEVSKEIEARALSYRFRPAAVGYEGLLYDLYDRKLTYDQFLDEVVKIEEVNTDWFDLLYRTAFSQKHHVSISGANDKVNYYFSGAYTDSQSNVRENGVKQYNATLKMQFNLHEKLTANVQLMTDLSTKNYHHQSIDPYRYAYETSRAIPAYNEDGSLSYYYKEQGFNDNPLKYNILHEIDHSGRTLKGNNILLDGKMEWRLLPGLRATGTAAITTASTFEKEWYEDDSYAAAKLRRTNYGVEFPTEAESSTFRTDLCRLPYGGELKSNDTRRLSYTLRGQLDYNKIINLDHSVTLVGGSEIRSTRYEGLKSVQWGYQPDRGEKFDNINMGEWIAYRNMVAANPNVVTNRLENYLSWYGIASYSYKGRYILNANIRTDGSNKLGQDPSVRFLPVWSAATRWNIHNEGFLEDAMWLNELSIKGSYGRQGNVSPENSPEMILNQGARDAFSGYYSNTVAVHPNSKLKWEKTNSFNIGLDFALFNNRISGAVEYYYKKGIDQLVNIEVSPTIGVSSMYFNIGDVMNKGYDLVLNFVPVKTKDFTWSLNLNGGKNVNKVTRGNMTREYTYAQYVSGSAVFKGYAINSFFSYQFDGLDENGLPTFKGTTETHGQTKEDKYNEVFTYSGNRVPDIQGGFSNTFRYKDLTLNMFFSYSLGAKTRMNQLYANNAQYLPTPEQNMTSEFVNRWRKPGDEAWATIPTLSTDALLTMARSLLGTGADIAIGDNGWQMYNQSDLRVASTDFLRLRTLMLRYGLPTKLCKRIGAQSAGIRIEGNNIFTLASKKLNGQDPEQVSFGGIGATTPPISSCSLGIELSF
ncbi:MAG: SusC/RagA family TonB-linked outer membrane protein [Dysgonamonadaceae bacterium]|jgi:TonB-linked SusC/RagA family outer membrane protein|nr:SusC/RagA family TonB-linked outer membrane protein [Dysgonamonadaceae bacterium]